MASILMALIMGSLGGPAIAWAFRTPGPFKGYEKRKAKFIAGEGSDPDKAPFGPHKSFKQNAMMFGLIFATIGFFIGTLARDGREIA